MKNQIDKTKSFLHIQEVIGSSENDDKMFYSVDIDLQELIKTKTYEINFKKLKNVKTCILLILKLVYH